MDEGKHVTGEAGAEAPGPLCGIRVLEMGQLIAGPFCGQLLADFGADVVKVEPPGTGDPMRQWGKMTADGNPLWWPVIGRNKKSITLNLRTPDAREAVKALIAHTDILIENFRTGRMEEWGLSYEELAAINPGLIMVRITGFGQTGPYSNRAGFASVCEAMGGMRYVNGYPDRAPVRMGISLGDTLAGMNGFQGALLALQHRNRTGLGQVIDVSIYESVLSVMEGLVSEFDGAGYVRERAGPYLKGIAPSNAYPTRDGETIIIGANHDSLFRRLTDLMLQPELASDERFLNHQLRGQNQELLDGIIADWTKTRDAFDLEEALAAAGVPAGRAFRASDMLNDAHFAARDSITRVADSKLGSIAMQNVFPVLSASPGGIRTTGPDLGAHTDEILHDWGGYEQAKLDELKKAGVL